MIKTIAVLGAGTMGHGIAHASMTAGCVTRLYDISQAQLDKGRDAIGGIVQKGVELGKVTKEDGDAALGRLTLTKSVADAVAGADLIIEAAPEKIDLKIALLGEVEAYSPAEAVIAS